MAIVIPIDADTSALQRKLHGATSSLGGFAKMAGIAAGAAAMGGLVATLRIGTHRFMEHEKVAVRTDAVLKSTGNAAHVTAKQVDDLAKSIMAKSGIDNEQIQTGQNVLLQFRAIQNQVGANNDIFNQASQAMADMSVVMGGNTTMAAKMLGKALQDPEKAMGALKRANITFTDSQRDAIKYLDHHNRTLEAQKMVLEAVTRATGGQADALGTTLQGKLNIASTTFKNLAMDIAGTFLPKLADAATKVAGFFTELSQQKTFKSKIEFVVGKIRDASGRSFNSLLEWWTTQKEEVAKSPTSGVVDVKLAPSGAQQFTSFFNSLNNDSYLYGYKAAQRWVGGWFSGGGRKDQGVIARLDAWLQVNVTDPLVAFGKFTMKGIIGNIVEGFVVGTGSKLIDKIETKLTTMFNNLKGGIGGSIWSKVTDVLTPSTKALHLVDRHAVAKVLTDDMKSAIQSARNGLSGAASGLGGMLNQIVQANFRFGGTGPNEAELLKAARDLEDRRMALKEAELREDLEKSGNAADAQLALDEFLFDKSQTLRQRGVEDEQKANQTKIDDLATRFNKGRISAQDFANGLDGIIGAEKGTSLGDAFALAFENSIKGLKNAAEDIFNITGLNRQPFGPDIGKPGSFNEGGATAAARSQYQQDLADWREFQRLKRELRTADAKGKAEARRALNAFKREHPDLPDRLPTPQMYGIDKLATGGILTGPRYLAGEAGNEAVIPLGSSTASQMMRRAFADAVNGGGDTIINVEINAGLGTDPAELGREVVKAIKTFERKNGPVFASV